MDLAGKGMALLSARPTQPGLPHLEATLKRTGERRQALPRLSTQKPRSAISAPDTIISACALDQER